MNKKAVIGIVVGVVLVVGVALTVLFYFSPWNRDRFFYVVELVTEPSDTVYSLPRGKNFSILCKGVVGNYSSNLFDNLEWINPSGKVVKDGNVRTDRRSRTALYLNFTMPEPTDSGVYKCRATYDNREEHEVEVLINFIENRPNFYRSFQNVEVEEDSSARLLCSALGEQPFIYRWYNEKNQEIYSNSSSGVQITSSGSATELTIESTGLHHEGQYTCTATNKHGRASKFYYIFVQSESRNNSRNITTSLAVQAENITENSVKFDFWVTGYVHNFIVRYAEQPTPNAGVPLTNAVLWRAGDPYVVSNLIPGGRYHFQFQAFPSKYNSWSEVLQVTLLPGVPDVVLSSVKDGFVTLEWIRSTDDTKRDTIDKYELSYKTVDMTSGNQTNEDPPVVVEIPFNAFAKYTVGPLDRELFYEIYLRAHTESGYGRSFKTNIRFVS